MPDYDSGGQLPPGLSLVHNDSDLPEDVVITCSGGITLPHIGVTDDDEG